MDRIGVHNKATRSIIDKLRRRGHRVQKVSPNLSGYDILVDGICKIAIRGSQERELLHTVTTLGKTYAYRYQISNFNFHRHGRISTEPHVFCCSTQGKHGRMTFVIPKEEIGGKVFALHWSVRNHPYNGQYAGFINQWDIITRKARDLKKRTMKQAA